MPRMKLDDRDFNVKKLKVDYERSEFKRYDGDVPRTGTILICRVTKMWWTQAGDGTSAIKVLAVAEQNVGDRKKYNGLPVWDFLTFKPEAAFRYMPFILTFGIDLDDIKRRMLVADEPDRFGDPIEAIADWAVGSDDALCKIVIKNDPQYGAEPDREGWLEFEERTVDDEDDDVEEDDEPPARPTRRGTGTRSTSRTAGTRASRRQEPEPEDEDDEDDDDPDEDDEDDVIDDEPDEDIEDDDDEEAEAEEEPPARPARRGTTSRSSSARQPARSSARQPARSGGSRREASGSTRVGTRGTSTRGSSSRANEAAARDRRGRGSDDDPPF